MRQSFEEFLKNKYEHYRKGKKLVLYFDAWMSDLGIAGISQYAEEWSSQQPEDEVGFHKKFAFYHLDGCPVRVDWSDKCDCGLDDAILAKYKERQGDGKN